MGIFNLIPFLPKPKVIVLRKINGVPKIYRKKGFSMKQKEVCIDKIMYPIPDNIEVGFLDRFNKPQIFFMYNCPEPLTFHEISSNVSGSTLKNIVHSGITKNLLNRENEKILLLIAMAGIVFGAIGLIAFFYELTQFNMVQSQYNSLLLTVKQNISSTSVIPK